MWKKIEVTQEDIDRGRIADSRNCAIAVVLKDEEAYEISVAGLIVIGKDGYKATPELRRWIAAFDRGKAVKPITIEFVPYKFGENHNGGTYNFGKGRETVFICGDARVAGKDNGRVPLRKKQLHADEQQDPDWPIPDDEVERKIREAIARKPPLTKAQLRERAANMAEHMEAFFGKKD